MGSYDAAERKEEGLRHRNAKSLSSSNPRDLNSNVAKQKSNLTQADLIYESWSHRFEREKKRDKTLGWTKEGLQVTDLQFAGVSIRP